MPIDLGQIIQTAVEAAVQGQNPGQQAAPQDAGKPKRKGLTAPRALLMGAGAVAAGRLLLGSRGRDLLGNLQQQLATLESEHLGGGLLQQDEQDDEDFEEDEEFEDEPEGEYDEEEPEGEYEEDEETEGEYDEEEEPEGEYDEDEEPEGEYDEDEEPEGEEEEEERPRRRRTSSAGSRNGRH